MLLVSTTPKLLRLQQCPRTTVHFCLVPDHYTVVDYSEMSSESDSGKEVT